MSLTETTKLLEGDTDEYGTPSNYDFQSSEGAPEFILKQLLSDSEGIMPEDKEAIVNIRRSAVDIQHSGRHSLAVTLFAKLILHLSNRLLRG